MTTAISRTTLALAALLTVAAAPARAEEPLPAGYERMMFPDANFKPHLYVPVWADFTAGPKSWGNTVGTPGYRPVDLEIERYESEPDAEDLGNNPHWQMISVVEVPDEGPFKTQSWNLHVAGSAADMEYEVEDQLWRPIDIELYYRKDPYLGFVVPTYAGIWVVNTGPQYAEWDWVPPTEYFAFMDLLDQKYAEGWRPYDIEFAVKESKNFKGETLEEYVVGTALLARYWDDSTPSTTPGLPAVPFVPTIWKWFDPWSEPLLYDEKYAGWQLLDVEVPPEVDADDDLAFGYGHGRFFSHLRHRRARFGIFVNTEFLPVEETHTVMGIETPNGKIYNNSENWQGESRLIDVELDGVVLKGDKKAVEPWPHYTHVWLRPGD